MSDRIFSSYGDIVRHITRRWIPFAERRGLEDMTLGPTAYLAAKAKGDRSMPSKRERSEDADDPVPRKAHAIRVGPGPIAAPCVHFTSSAKISSCGLVLIVAPSVKSSARFVCLASVFCASCRTMILPLNTARAVPPRMPL